MLQLRACFIPIHVFDIIKINNNNKMWTSVIYIKVIYVQMNTYMYVQ